MLLRRVLLLFLMVAGFVAGPARCPAAMTATEAKAAQFAEHDSTAYTLPPDKMRKAVGLTHIRDALLFSGRDLAARATHSDPRCRLGGADAGLRSWAREEPLGAGLRFRLLFLLTTTLLTLPLDVYRHHVSLSYGFSVQGWASWLGDMGKSFLS